MRLSVEAALPEEVPNPDQCGLQVLSGHGDHTADAVPRREAGVRRAVYSRVREKAGHPQAEVSRPSYFRRDRFSSDSKVFRGATSCPD